MPHHTLKVEPQCQLTFLGQQVRSVGPFRVNIGDIRLARQLSYQHLNQYFIHYECLVSHEAVCKILLTYLENTTSHSSCPCQI
jgi:hypothetical protein